MKTTDEQREFRDLVQRFLQEKVTAEYRRARVKLGAGVDPTVQKELQELGLFEGFEGESAPFSFQELGIVADLCGYFLTPSPLSERILSAGMVPRIIGSGDLAKIQSIAARGNIGTIANPTCCQVTLSTDESLVSGVISWAIGVEGSSWLLGFIGANDSARAFVCSLESANSTSTTLPSLDLTTQLHRIELRDAPAVVLSSESSLKIQDLLEAVKACEVAGICRRVIEMSVEYSKTRQQFGVAIGSFQAIQQKLADCYAKSESLASLSRFAMWSAANSPEQGRLTARAAIISAVENGPAICEAALQAHGGIGFTWEYDLHLYLRRAKAIQSAFNLSEDRARALISAVSTS